MEQYSSYASPSASRRPAGVGGHEQSSPHRRTTLGIGEDRRLPREDASFNVESVSSYQDYPTARPLLHDQYATRKSADKVRAVPESNSRAVISALRGLQEKIRKLELERTQAESNLKALSSETMQYRQALHKQTATKEAADSKMSTRYQEVQTHLSDAEKRASLLEKQLEYMRRMVQSAENDRQAALHQTEVRLSHDAMAQRGELHNQEEKLRKLEREHARLTANQSASEGKIKDLELRLQEERRHRRLLQGQAAELQTVAETNRILLATEQATGESKPKKLKKKKRKAPPRTSPRPSSASGRHCTGQLPFVVGQSTTPSHSVSANLQSLMALMKTHNTAWCNNGPLARRRPHTAGVRRSVSESSSASNGDLSDLLLGLQDEFAQMGFEHQDLAKQIRETEDLAVREDMERELDRLVSRMEAKGEQIAKLRRHKEQVTNKQQKAKTQKGKQLTQKATAGRRISDPSSSNGAEVQVITTVKTKGKGAGPVYVANSEGKRNMRVMRDIRTLQTSLRKDDVSWE